MYVDYIQCLWWINCCKGLTILSNKTTKPLTYLSIILHCSLKSFFTFYYLKMLNLIIKQMIL